MVEDGQKIYSQRLLGLKRKCSECGTTMSATGNMHYNVVFSEWFIEYWCPTDQEYFNVYVPEMAHLTAEIAQDVGQ
jgi:hypothetical protein